ncbi:hypothetical protein FQN55_003177 [Onygenales sp. PD_40]|nr:hypothetical protein FQN55_003177 [Onygenales sp. PD_40]
MTSPIPKTTKQWKLVGQDGFDGLKYTEEPVAELGDNQVLVKIKAASLNPRDLLITRGLYPFPLNPTGIVPGSDGAGTVLAIGKHVTRFQPGDNVLTTINPTYLSGSITAETARAGLGAELDGTFRELGAFDEQGLVRMPEGLGFREAATLSCAGLTAWNVLFGERRVGEGQWVLTEGTGGVSLFVIRFAKAVGARVIGTTGRGEVGRRLLEGLGVDFVIDYREEKEWGVKAKEVTGGVGVDVVVDVVGPRGLGQSAKAVKLDGVINVIGAVGGFEEGDKGEEIPGLLDTWLNLYTARGVWVGNRAHMEEMCRAIEGNAEKMRPVIDERSFKLEDLKEAYEYMAEGKHLGKVCIDIA